MYISTQDLCISTDAQIILRQRFDLLICISQVIPGPQRIYRDGLDMSWPLGCLVLGFARSQFINENTLTALARELRNLRNNCGNFVNNEDVSSNKTA